MTLHDRSQAITLHLDYDIPREDLDVPVGEVPGGRTHQFFAFCRSHDASDFLPTWITATDVQAAADWQLIVADSVGAADILETNDPWAGCWYRINADDDRRPISYDAASSGVDWDLSDVPGGAYTLSGYTFDPIFNVWWQRPGVVKIHDGDRDAIGPAAAITTDELTPYRDESVLIEGCVDAVEGSTTTLSWAVVTPDPPQWETYGEPRSITADAFIHALEPPQPMWGEAVLLRIDVEDPMGRRYSAHASHHMLVIDADTPSDDPAATTGMPPSSTPPERDGARGCACASGPALVDQVAGVACAWFIIAFAPRRRRHPPERT